ncbi:MAG: cell envelope integrity EipB family protein, partial [Alphaproteobacteria bacterium]|nr:cell envelope integrity EipB family protein [Alphaproteobacteria bacterium]
IAAFAAFLLVASPALAAPLDVPLAAHKALYTMTLGRVRGDVTAAKGTMGYEVIDACDGWAVRQRLDMRIANADGQTINMVSDYATWESKDGLRFRFHMKQTTDEAVTAQTDGDARLERAGGPGVAHYTVPHKMDKNLPPGTLFPMAHTARLLQRAETGDRHFTIPLFDGTDDTGGELSSIVVTGLLSPRKMPWPALSALPSAVVDIAFFALASRDMLPDYDTSMRYWTNGVADNIRMDFGDFVMRGKMVDFAPQPRKC